jgi:hypothetical protein
MTRIIAYCKNTRKIIAESLMQGEPHVFRCVDVLDTLPDGT